MLKPINSGQAARIPLKDLWQIDTNKTKIINITKTYATVIDISSQLEPPVKPANGELERPKIENFFPNKTLKEMMMIYKNSESLFSYVKELDKYIDELESRLSV